MPKLTKKQRLWQQRLKIDLEISAIETKERRKESEALCGRCFKYRNCYSCPQTDSDYWDLFRVYSDTVNKDGTVTYFEFETDKNGEFKAHADSSWLCHDGWKEVDRNSAILAFDARLRDIKKQFNKAML